MEEQLKFCREGPEFLTKPFETWPKQPILTKEVKSGEERTIVLTILAENS